MPNLLPSLTPIESNKRLIEALTWLLDDLTDAGEHCNPETKVVYDSVAFARDALAAAKQAQAGLNH